MYQLARWVEQLTEKSHESQNAAITALQDRLVGHFSEITEDQAYDLLTELLLVMGAAEESV